MGGIAIGGPELCAVMRGTWPIVGVALFGRLVVCIDVIVAIDDCELDLAGLPGRMMNGAGEGCEGGTGTGDAFINEGDAVAVGVGTGVAPADDVGRGIDVDTTG